MAESKGTKTAPAGEQPKTVDRSRALAVLTKVRKRDAELLKRLAR